MYLYNRSGRGRGGGKRNKNPVLLLFVKEINLSMPAKGTHFNSMKSYRQLRELREFSSLDFKP